MSFARERLASHGDRGRGGHSKPAITRFRPVLMTALAMIIGMVPMALGLGEGGEQNAPLGPCRHWRPVVRHCSHSDLRPCGVLACYTRRDPSAMPRTVRGRRRTNSSRELEGRLNETSSEENVTTITGTETIEVQAMQPSPDGLRTPARTATELQSCLAAAALAAIASPDLLRYPFAQRRPNRG